MKFFEIIGIVAPIIIMFALIVSVITRKPVSDFDIYIAVIVSGLVSLGIAYYFHKKDTPAQRTWNQKRQETMEDLFDLFEQLSRQIRVGCHSLDKLIDKTGYNTQTVNIFTSNNQQGLQKINQLRSLIFNAVERNYNYLTNKETRKFKMLAEMLIQYLNLKLRRPEHYLDDIKYFEMEHTTKREFIEMFDEVNLQNKNEFLKCGVFEFRDSDLEGRWENTHTY